MAFGEFDWDGLIGETWAAKKATQTNRNGRFVNISDYTTMYTWDYTTPKGWLCIPIEHPQALFFQ